MMNLRKNLGWLVLFCLAALCSVEGQPRRIPREKIEGDWMVTLLPLDGIPSIDEPEFVSAEEASKFLRDQDLVMGIVQDGQAKAYPTWVLNAHEVVNDRIGATPIAATW